MWTSTRLGFGILQGPPSLSGEGQRLHDLAVVAVLLILGLLGDSL